jgi:flavin-dependent dehydrogenase
VATLYGRPVSYGIRRCEFDHYLRERSGARMRLEEPLETICRENDRWIVNGDISAAVVVGAGGHFCPVARQLSEEDGEDAGVVVAQEIEFEMSADEERLCRVEREVPELYFCNDLRGYAWCFRKGDFLNIGLGREGETRLSAHVSAFCQFLQQQERIPPGTHDRFRGHAYRLYRGRPRRVTADGVVLIGDSAGLAYPQSGEGIRPAIESGLMAARLIVESVGDYRQVLLAGLQKELAARFGPLKANSSPRGILPTAWRQALARRLLATHWFTRHVLINRWFLHAHQPALAPMGSKVRPHQSSGR